jgi:hypothetical protein
MSEAIISRLNKHDFRFQHEHIAIDGSHAAPLKHMTLVEEYLQTNFLAENANDCPR